MVSLSALWLPILLSAVAVWIVSAIVWMALPYHKSDFRPLSNEDDMLGAFRTARLGPGIYMFPWASSQKEMQQPEIKAKFDAGPVGLLTIFPPGRMKMAKPMIQSFLYYLVISLFAAYVASRTLLAPDEYLTVFRLVGTVAALAYAAGHIQNSIWFGTPWRNTWKHVFDGLVYGLVTAGVFGWLWPN